MSKFKTNPDIIDTHEWPDSTRCTLISTLQLALVYADEISTCFPDVMITDFADCMKPQEELDAIRVSQDIIRSVIKTDCIAPDQLVPVVHAIHAVQDMLVETDCSEATKLSAAAYGLPPNYSLSQHIRSINNLHYTLVKMISHKHEEEAIKLR